MAVHKTEKEGAERQPDQPRKASLRVLAVFIRPGGTDRIWGSERSFVDLSNGLVRLGAEVDAVELSPSVSTVVKTRFNHYVLGSSSRLSILRVFSHTLETIRIALNRRCQVVFIPTVYFGESMLIGLATHLILRKPLFVGLVGPIFERQDRTNLVDLIAQGLKGSRRKRSVFTDFVRRLTVRVSAGVLVSNRQLATYGKNVLGASDAVVIGRGVDDSWFETGDSDPAKVYDVIYVGRLDRYKGAGALLEAWKIVSTNIPGSRLMVVGSGDTSAELKRRAQELGLSDLVTFAGYINSAGEIRRLMRLSKIFALPSEAEGFARVIAEAMACGLPCITSDTPDLRELYLGTAVLVPPRDPVRLAEAISSLLIDNAKRQELSGKSLALARTFRWGKVASLAYGAFEHAVE